MGDRLNKRNYTDTEGNGRMRHWLCCLLMAGSFLALALFCGCGETNQQETASAGAAAVEAAGGEIDDVVQIPADGIITAEQFAAFAGTDRTVVFEGSSEDIDYAWSFSGKKIQNPAEQNLSIGFLTEDKDLKEIKKISGGASCAIGLTLSNEMLVASPSLQITLPEKWDADTAVLCKDQDGTAARMADVEIRAEGKGKKAHTVLTVKITEANDTYYIVAGNSEGGTSADKDSAKQESDEKTGKTSSAKEDSSSASDSSGSTDTEDSGEEYSSEDYTGEDSDGGSGSDSGNGSDSDSGWDSDSEAGEDDAVMQCTISINCATILDHMDQLTAGKEEFVPADGVILATSTVTFEEGDTVFDVLLRACQEAGIHMEHSYTPVYGSEYIEGINQLYEMDCGELSGWQYKVNGWSVNYGSDKYVLSDGDEIEWLYTCDLGKDI